MRTLTKIKNTYNYYRKKLKNMSTLIGTDDPNAIGRTWRRHLLEATQGIEPWYRALQALA
jgi:hypothetical protein